VAVGDAAPGECAMHLKMPAMAAAPREGATKIAVQERAAGGYKAKVPQEATREPAARPESEAV